MEGMPKTKGKARGKLLCVSEGQSNEVLLELSKKGEEAIKGKAIISAYERKKIKKEQTRLRRKKVAIILYKKRTIKEGKEVTGKNEEVIEQNEEVIEQNEEEPQKIIYKNI